MPDKPPREILRFGSFNIPAAGPRRSILRSHGRWAGVFFIFVFGVPLLFLTGAQLAGKLSKDMPQTFRWAAGLLPSLVVPVFRSAHSLVTEDNTFRCRERRVAGPTLVRTLARSEVAGLVLSTERLNCSESSRTCYRILDLQARDGALLLFAHTSPAKVERAAEQAAQATGLPLRKKN
jgi:hypothetical protein